MSSTLSDCQTTEENSAGALLGNLVLRICGGGYEDHTIRLPGNKLTLGSDPDCSVQLHDDDIDPVHCMILRGSDSTVVRSWGSRSTLDGIEFSDACLSAGACLQLGDVQLQILELHDGGSGEVTIEDCSDSKTKQFSDSANTGHHRCERCEAQFDHFESRLASIERQLDLLAAAMHNAPLRCTGTDACAGDKQANQPPGIPAGLGSGGLPLALLTEEAAYQARPVDQRDNQPTQSGASVRTAPSDLPSWAEAYQSDDVDESVKDYVERLLQRVGNASDRQDASEAEDWPASASADRVPAADEESSILAALMAEEDEPQPVSSVPAEPADLPDEPYVPRSLPPERLTNLSEMRELANVSAEAAIRSFEKQRDTKNAVDRLPLVLVGLACGIFLLCFAATRNAGLVQILLLACAGISFLASAGAGWQALSVLRRWMPSAYRPHDDRREKTGLAQKRSPD